MTTTKLTLRDKDFKRISQQVNWCGDKREPTFIKECETCKHLEGRLSKDCTVCPEPCRTCLELAIKGNPLINYEQKPVGEIFSKGKSSTAETEGFTIQIVLLQDALNKECEMFNNCPVPEPIGEPNDFYKTPCIHKEWDYCKENIEIKPSDILIIVCGDCGGKGKINCEYFDGKCLKSKPHRDIIDCISDYHKLCIHKDWITCRKECPTCQGMGEIRLKVMKKADFYKEGDATWLKDHDEAKDISSEEYEYIDESDVEKGVFVKGELIK